MTKKIATAQYIRFSYASSLASKRAQIVCAATIGANNALGIQREKLIAEHLKASGRYTNVVSGKKITLPDCDGFIYKQHTVDIVCISDTSIELYNSKSRGQSNTNDPLPQLFSGISRPLEEYKKLYPMKHVSYQILRAGGKTTPAFKAAGIVVYDTNEYLTKLRGFTVDIDEEEAQLFSSIFRTKLQKLIAGWSVDKNLVDLLKIEYSL